MSHRRLHRRACDPSSPSLRSAHRARARAGGSGSDRTAQSAGLLEPGVSGNVRRWCTRRLAWSTSLQATSRAQSRSLLYSARSPLAITEPPGLCREDADFELVGGKTQFVSPSKHDLEVAHIGRDGPPELVERQTGVLAEPARYEPVEDKGWLATGRGTEVQELGAERRSEVRQPGDAVVAQARIPIDRPPFNSCAGGGLKSASAFGTASSTRRTRNGPYPTRPYPQAPKAGCPRTSTTPAWAAPCPRAPTPTWTRS